MSFKDLEFEDFVKWLDDVRWDKDYQTGRLVALVAEYLRANGKV